MAGVANHPARRGNVFTLYAHRLFPIQKHPVVHPEKNLFHVKIYNTTDAMCQELNARNSKYPQDLSENLSSCPPIFTRFCTLRIIFLVFRGGT